MTICPCCGSSFEGTLEEGCTSCGAHAIGAPLPAPMQQLPAYERAFIVALISLLLGCAFLASIIASLIERAVFPLSLWDLTRAIETAAWRLKFSVLPLAALGLWASVRITASMRRAPKLFTGHRVAHTGVSLLALIILTGVVGIGVTIPARLRLRQIEHEAANNALLYASHRAILDYQACYGTYPATLDDLRKLPDSDGSIAAALNFLATTDYRPSSPPTAQLPSSNKRNRLQRNSIAKLRPVSLNTNTEENASASVSFNTYELVWAGEDKIYGTADDRVMRDGAFVDRSQTTVPHPRASATATPGAQ